MAAPRRRRGGRIVGMDLILWILAFFVGLPVLCALAVILVDWALLQGDE